MPSRDLIMFGLHPNTTADEILIALRHLLYVVKHNDVLGPGLIPDQNRGGKIDPKIADPAHVLSVTIPIDRQLRLPRRCGYVTFSTPITALNALAVVRQLKSKGMLKYPFKGDQFVMWPDLGGGLRTE